jgi:hypothetical protein
VADEMQADAAIEVNGLAEDELHRWDDIVGFVVVQPRQAPLMRRDRDEEADRQGDEQPVHDNWYGAARGPVLARRDNVRHARRRDWRRVYEAPAEFR